MLQSSGNAGSDGEGDDAFDGDSEVLGDVVAFISSSSIFASPGSCGMSTGSVSKFSLSISSSDDDGDDIVEYDDNDLPEEVAKYDGIRDFSFLLERPSEFAFACSSTALLNPVKNTGEFSSADISCRVRLPFWRLALKYSCCLVLTSFITTRPSLQRNLSKVHGM